jgi:hypothetical protein
MKTAHAGVPFSLLALASTRRAQRRNPFFEWRM